MANLILVFPTYHDPFMLQVSGSQDESQPKSEGRKWVGAEEQKWCLRLEMIDLSPDSLFVYTLYFILMLQSPVSQSVQFSINS